MQTKTFFIVSLLVIAIVSIVTSFIGISVLNKSVLLAPAQEGTLNIPGGVASVTNVVVEDVVVSDTITFSGVIPGVSVRSDLLASTVNQPPHAVLKNDGNVDADISINFLTTRLFSDSGSNTQVWAEEAFAVSGEDPGYQNIDSCITADPTNGCINGAISCTEAAPCTLTTSSQPLLVSLDFEDIKDNVYLGFILNPSTSETGSPSAIFSITGTQSATQV